jgi:hypothetical protein
MRSFLPQVLYTVWCLFKLYAQENICKKQLVGEKNRKKATAQIGTNARDRVFNTGRMARNQFASGRSCNRPTQTRFSVFFLGPRANAKLVPKFHVALHASHAAVQTVILKISPYTNVA